MKRRMLLASLLAAVIALLAGCQRLPGHAPAAARIGDAQEETALLPDAEPPASARVSESATIWFRFHDEPYLAPETQTVKRSPNVSFELTLMRALIAGPDIRFTALSPVFPEGTTVVSASVTGRTLYVTFSRELMNRYADEPKDWSSDTYWSREVPLRRELCLQAIAATATENCEVDNVQVLVANANGGADRLTMDYFPESAPGSMPADPAVRDDALLLTPDRAMDTALTALQEQDWQRLYLYLCENDPVTGAARTSYNDFMTVMDRMPRLTSFTLSDGSLSGSDAVTYGLDAELLSGGRTVDTGTRTIRLYREKGLWLTTQSQLTGWMEDGYE